MMMNAGEIVLRVSFVYFLWWKDRRYFATATTVAEITPGKEYCQNEVFSAECSSDSVVQILSADYGRMYVGRCVRKDYGFIGCRQSVLGIMDFFCGGRRACSVRVPNEHFDAAAQAACPEDFKFFLEVRFECIKVVHVTKPTCRSLHVRNEPEGAIASVVTMETDCGSDQLPWRIELLPGQRINVTLYDFVYASREIARQSSDAKCVAYAIFKEPNVVPSHTMCGGAERVSIGYVSVAEKVQIVIMKRSDAETHRYFVLKYTAIGCGHPVAPAGGWALRVKDDQARFGCNYSSVTWTLKCHGWKWVGTPSNCTIPENTLGLTGTSLSQSLTFEMAVGAVVFIALIIASLILCIGILLIRRYGRTTKPILEMIPAGGAMYDIDGGGSDCIVRSNDLDRDSDQYRDLNDYAYIDSNQQIQGLHHCRHGAAPSSFSPDGGHIICEISKRETSHPSRGQTPYSTLERNAESGTSPAGDWKAAEGSIPKVDKKIEKSVKPEWYHHSYSDSILSNSEPARRYSYQVKAILK